MKLVIAEKPMLARDIARAMCGRSVDETEKLPVSGNGYTVAACAGHLLELQSPDEIREEWKSPWRLDALPISIDDWPKKVIKGKEHLVKQLCELLAGCECVIHAGDPDDEGQLIVDEVLDHLGYEGRVLRVFVNDNLEKNIRKAFEELEPNEKHIGAGRAALARQIADFCFGVNETRLASLKLGARVNVGRVQTPTLGLVVARDEAVAKHVKKKYYELIAHGSLAESGRKVSFKLKPNKEFLGDDKRVYEADSYSAAIERVSGALKEVKTEVNEERKSPPLPYNLTVLLADMNARYGFSASKTQQITQVLKDRYKAITYNRTDSQYLKDEHHAAAEAVLGCAMQNLDESWPLDFSLKSRAFNGKNVTAHHGIIPQEVTFDLKALTADERKVYRAIAERYAMQFLPAETFEVSTSSFIDEAGVFEYVAKRVTCDGYKSVFKASDIGEEAEPEGTVWIDAGAWKAQIDACEMVEKQTSPPKAYTEGTLLKDMAAIAKYVADPDIKAILKKKDEEKKGEHGGIGTSATRSEIIKGLKEKGYIEEVKGKIRSTKFGRAFYNLLPAELKSADTTARWWLLQQEIAEGRNDVNAIQRSVVEVFLSHSETAYEGLSLKASTSRVVGSCPRCGCDMILYEKVCTCSSNKSEKQGDGSYRDTEGCGFKFFTSVSGKKLSETAIKELLGRGVTKKMAGFKSKRTGKSFSAKLRLKEDGSFEMLFG